MFTPTARKTFALGLLLVGTFLHAAIAEGVTAASKINDDESVATVTTGAATRARAEVQIRRIKTLILTKSSDSDADYEQLEKLQKDLRGER